MTGGDIGECLNIPGNSRTVRGNIYRDGYSRILEEKFDFFRGDWADESADAPPVPINASAAGAPVTAGILTTAYSGYACAARRLNKGGGIL